ncbi:tyrosine-type recombinase/integrase [Bosea lupini]|uniref:tyrosine-type recombinase/integrase n=1 Tax=Bosea lupini TaxID=1036779 RepID=UPI001FCD84EF|nr:site-specific integrase [Bosea lupini]
MEVRALKAEAGQRLVVRDGKVPGLTLRVSPTSKAWSFVYRVRGEARQRRYSIGTYPAWSVAAARDKALALKKRVQDGGDPVIEEKIRREALTFSKLVERFMASHGKKIRSAAEYQQLLDKDVIPRMGERRVDEITRPEVGVLLDDVAKRAPVVANRVMSVISSVFSWAVSEGLAKENPVRGLKKRGTEAPKERHLDAEEIRALWSGLNETAPRYADLVRLVLLLGARPGEVAGMSREEIDLDAAVWRIPGERVKTKTAHVLPLVGEALAIVRRLSEGKKRGPLFLTTKGKAPTSQDLAKAFERTRTVLKSPATPHDLRRTAATIMSQLEIDRLTIAYVLNHQSTVRATVTGSTYDRHDFLVQKKRALEALDAQIAAILNNQRLPTNVVQMHGGTHG